MLQGIISIATRLVGYGVVMRRTVQAFKTIDYYDIDTVGGGGVFEKQCQAVLLATSH